MAKSDDTTKKDAPAGTPAAAVEAPQRQQIPVDESQMVTAYANYCRASMIPEELVIDFGLNTNVPPVQNAQPIRINHRLVINYYTAKRLLGVLQVLIQRHEAAFGVLETDIQKRARAGTQQSPTS